MSSCDIYHATPATGTEGADGDYAGVMTGQVSFPTTNIGSISFSLYSTSSSTSVVKCYHFEGSSLQSTTDEATGKTWADLPNTSDSAAPMTVEFNFASSIIPTSNTRLVVEGTSTGRFNSTSSPPSADYQWAKTTDNGATWTTNTSYIGCCCISSAGATGTVTFPPPPVAYI